MVNSIVDSIEQAINPGSHLSFCCSSNRLPSFNFAPKSVVIPFSKAPFLQPEKQVISLMDHGERQQLGARGLIHGGGNKGRSRHGAIGSRII